MSATRKAGYTVHDKAYYLDPRTIQFVRPGLTINIVSAKIASDGTISVDFKLTDVPPAGSAAQPLDITGVNTPGPISVSFLIAYIPKGQEQYVSYITRLVTAATGGATGTQAAGESMTTGTLTTVTQGEYVYTFKTKAPTGFDPTATHRVGVYGSRNLTEFDLGTNYDDATFDFVPAGGTPAPRDIIRTADCNSCHDSLAAHGGSRKSVDLCIMCHTPQTTDPNSGNTLDLKVFIHKIHMGEHLPSVQARTPFQIIGFQNSVNDWSTVVYPSNPGDPRNCSTCHNPKNGAAQTNAWLTKPSMAACGSCHDDVNFATGKNHPGGPQVDDSQCAMCHIPQGELEFDASIMGAHTNPTESASAPGINFTLVKVDNGVAGKAPTLTFTVKDNAGNGISMAQLTGGSNRLALVMAGPTSDYGYTSFGSDVTTPGYVSENPVPTAQCSPDGTCSYTFTHSIPTNATGTYSIGIEGRRGLTILPGTTSQMTTEYGGINKVINFSVDGSPITPRRTVVSINNCNNCHTKLSLHGENRNQIEMCVLCHNPSENDISQRVNATNPADKAAPAEGVNFTYMIHRIHLGVDMTSPSVNTTFTIVGFGGSHNNFDSTFASVPSTIPNTGVRYPAMDNTGATQHVAACYMCHVNGSEAVLPIGLNPVTNPTAPLNPAPATTSACTACHALNSTFAHAQSNTDPKFGESCNVCHGTGAAFSTTQVHAQ
ncbi:MAG TPA: OmcA/MtrC family decaheme c-type cytochrome [Bryobacteraceae bacterium]|nr:OmcA/MtrC family decaheme c-type cytochrome [Bryobacteraceae bacterium]